MTAKAKRKATAADPVKAYVEEIDRFAALMREQKGEIEELQKEVDIARQVLGDATAALREAKATEDTTFRLLRAFVIGGCGDILPLFDTMAAADESIHGEHSTEWRKEPIVAIGLSSPAANALVAADIVLVGQLQDRVLRDGLEWATEIDGISDGMAQAIEEMLTEFVNKRAAG